MFEGTETIPQDMQKSLNFAVDVADEIMRQSMDFAQSEYVLSEIRSSDFAQGTSNAGREIIKLALGHAQIATSLLIAREKTDALTFALENLVSAIGDVAQALDAGAADTSTKRAPLPKTTPRKT